MNKIILATALLTNVVQASTLFADFKMEFSSTNYTYRLTVDGLNGKFTTDYPFQANFKATTDNLTWTGPFPANVPFTIDPNNLPVLGDTTYGIYYYFEPPFPTAIVGLSPASEWTADGVVPEPTSVGLFALGLGAFAVYRKWN